jgi:hypothetical protein
MKILRLFSVIAIIFLAVYLYGCSSGAKDDLFGVQITENTVTPIGKILSQPKEFDNKTVLLEGKVLEECPAGGWVHLKDDTGVIYVNLHPSNFAIPQIIGKKIAVQGKVRKEGTQIELVGEGVQLK